MFFAGCSNYEQPVQHPQINVLIYQCDEGPLVVQEDITNKQASFLMGDEFLVLNQGLSCSGKRFTDGVYAYWTQKDSAIVYKHDWTVLHHCIIQSTSDA